MRVTQGLIVGDVQEQTPIASVGVQRRLPRVPPDLGRESLYTLGVFFTSVRYTCISRRQVGTYFFKFTTSNSSNSNSNFFKLKRHNDGSPHTTLIRMTDTHLTISHGRMSDSCRVGTILALLLPLSVTLSTDLVLDEKFVDSEALVEVCSHIS